MTEATKTLAQLKKASKLTRLAFHKNGPKSYKRGQGALLNALLANDGTTQRELVKTMGMDRSDLKGIVKKAERNGYVTIEDAEGERTYAVKLTDEGREVAQKRVAANDKTADDIIGCLSEEEIAQLNRSLMENGVVIYGLNAVGMSLEQSFMAITGGGNVIV